VAIGKAHIFRGRRVEETVLVVVRRGCILHHEGRTYGEGELLALKLEDLAKLEEHGVVSRRS
jgi:hypothetical protein